MTAVWLGIFWAMCVVGQVLLKYGSTSSTRWVPCFVISNTVGVSSASVLMIIYKSMNANVALGLGMGGGFLLAQLALALIFPSTVSPIQLLGVLAIGGGMAALAGGGRVGIN